MADHGMTRRDVLHLAAAGAALGWGSAPAGGADLDSTPHPFAKPMLLIRDPIDGAVLNRHYGKQDAGGLTIRVRGEARPGDRVTLNGVPCRVEGTRFEGETVLRAHETELVAEGRGGGDPCRDRARVIWDRYSEPRYRFSIDDNSFFLRDIAQKKPKSLFECFYLKGLRALNQKYGTKFTVNIYYAAATQGEPGPGDFRLPQFPDRYKSEWRDHAHWLKLAFHAYQNMPNRPYEDAPPEKLIADLDAVAAEIHRFAGEATYAPPTVIHWAVLRREALKPLYDRGVRVLSGDFRYGDKWDIHYSLEPAVCEHLVRQNAWKDSASGIVFHQANITCNNVPLKRIVPHLEEVARYPAKAEIMDLFTHEQYFWPFYVNYVPDHFQRLDAALRWVTEHGYKPVFFHEGFLGGRV